MRTARTFTMAAILAATAWTNPTPAWTAPDWPEPARPGEARTDAHPVETPDYGEILRYGEVPHYGEAGQYSATAHYAEAAGAEGEPGPTHAPTGIETDSRTQARNRMPNGLETNRSLINTGARAPTPNAVTQCARTSMQQNVERRERQPRHDRRHAHISYDDENSAEPTACPCGSHGRRAARRDGKEAPGFSRRG